MKPVMWWSPVAGWMEYDFVEEAIQAAKDELAALNEDGDRILMNRMDSTVNYAVSRHDGQFTVTKIAH